MSNQHKPFQKFNSINELPVQRAKRNCTDVCCLIIGLAFSVIIITIATVLFNKSTFYKVNFPTDSDGQLCGYDLPDYQYLYFSIAPLTTSRVCVSKCPSKGDISLSCHPNSLISNCNFSPINKYYDSAAQKTRMGFFCYPTDQSVKTILKQNAHINDQQDFYQALDTIKSAMIVAVILSFVYLISVQCIPRIMNYAVVILGVIVLLVTTIYVFSFKTQQILMKNIIGFALVIVIILIIVSVIKGTLSLKMHAIFISYSTKMIAQRILVLVYIPIYLFFILGFIALVLFQFAGFWTAGRPIFVQKEYLYYKLNGISVLPIVSAVLIVHFIWGVGFLKQSFNFCISGNSVLWFFSEDKKKQLNDGIFEPFILQISKHIGSVIGGSFITAFFSLFDFLFDLLKLFSKQGTSGKQIDNCCIKIFDLVRSDAMAYISLTDNPFCNSARYCEYLCDKTIITRNTQTSSRIYRVCAHFFIVGLTVIYTMLATDNKSIYALGLIIFGSLTISTFFISLHADGAEAIQILYLTDQQFLNRQTNDGVHKPDSLGSATFRKEIAKEIYQVYQNYQAKNQEK